MLLAGPKILANQQVDRRDMVKAVYENFLGTLYFLSGNSQFINQLSTQEKQQFELIGNLLIARVTRFGFGAAPGIDQTSRHVPFELIFSSDQNDFILNPGEPPRTAKFKNGIYFNLNLINQQDSKIGILDIQQILFHEFGHLLEKQKNQAAIDQVAAKMANYLRSYVNEVGNPDGSRFLSFVLPQLFFDHNVLIDYQAEPLVFIETDGKVHSIRADARDLLPLGVGYYSSNRGQVNIYSRLDLKPKAFSHQNKLYINWSIESRSIVMDGPGQNYIKLYSDMTEMRDNFVALPQVSRYQVNQAIQIDRHQKLSLKNISISPMQLPPKTEQKWHEKLVIKHQDSELVRLEAVIESKDFISSVSLVGAYSEIESQWACPSIC